MRFGAIFTMHLLKQKLLICSILFLSNSCRQTTSSSPTIPDNDTLAIIKVSLDSSFSYAKNHGRRRLTADTSAFTSISELNIIMSSLISKQTQSGIAYLNQDSLCRIAHETAIVSNNRVTNLVSLFRDSLDNYHVVLERARMIPEVRVIDGDTVNSCGFGASLEWMIFLKFKKTGNTLTPVVEHWENH